MDHELPTTVLHWNYRNFTEFPIQNLKGSEEEITDLYLKENLISRIPTDIGKLVHLESLYLSGNDIEELPKEICLLRCLKCLDLSGNRLRKIPEDIGEVKGLKFLILDENELSELPLRIAELRALRYLSVCDNKLQWLPQRPVFNYHHCEFRFWRNTTLKTIPYSLWYHMFRGQQTRSLNIGCLSIQKHNHQSKLGRCRLKLAQDFREWTMDVECPSAHRVIFDNHCFSPPSLYESCRRIFYENLAKTARRLSTEVYSVYSDNKYSSNNNKLANLEDVFQEICLNNANMNYDLNGNLQHAGFSTSNYIPPIRCRDRNRQCVPADLVTKYFGFLPSFIKQDLSNGPVSRCENVRCMKPVFDYAFYEFCLGNLILIDSTEEIILSAAFCSKTCANEWSRGKTNLLSWSLIEKV